MRLSEGITPRSNWLWMGEWAGPLDERNAYSLVFNPYALKGNTLFPKACMNMVARAYSKHIKLPISWENKISV